MAKTLLNYSPIEPHRVSFGPNLAVRVLSKGIGSHSNLWGIEVQGRRGYAAKTHLQETKVEVKMQNLMEVPSEAFLAKPTDTQPPADVQNTINESMAKEESIPSEGNNKIETVSVETQDQQQGSNDRKKVSSSENEISEKTDSIEKYQQKDPVKQQHEQRKDNDIQKAIAETVTENTVTTEAPKERKEISEHDDDEDEGFNDDDEDGDEEENVEMDEDDLKDYAGREPVTEPPVIRKHAYQTGEKEGENLENAAVKLEIIGSEAKRPEENNEIDNNTVSVVESEAEKIEVPASVVLQENVPEVKNDAANKKKSEVPNGELSEATTELPLADNETLAVSSEITSEKFETNAEPNNATETHTETNDLKSSNSSVGVKKNDETVKLDEKSSVPVEASKVSVFPPPVQDKQTTTEATPFEQPIKNVEQNPTVDDVDGFDRNIKKILNIVQESIERSTPLPNNLSPSISASGVSAERVSGDSSAQQLKDVVELNARADDKVNQVNPINNVFDTVVINEPVETSNVVVETPTKIVVDEIVEVAEIKDEVMPIPDEISEEELTTTPLPIVDVVDDIFKNGPATIEDVETVETFEAGNWYDGAFKTIFEAYSSILQLFYSGVGKKNDNADRQQKMQADFDTLEDGYCEKLDDGSCPKQASKSVHTHDHVIGAAIHHVNYDEFAQEFLRKVVAMADIVILLTLTATAVLIFIFGHYCLANNHKESALISKLNIIEKKLLMSEKECSIVKADLIQTRKQLVSIEDSSFGSNDMVIALKQQLEQSEKEKLELQQQIVGLEKVSNPMIAYRIRNRECRINYS